MKTLRCTWLLALSVALIGYSESGPWNVLDGASQEKIDAYTARQAAVDAVEDSGKIVDETVSVKDSGQ